MSYIVCWWCLAEGHETPANQTRAGADCCMSHARAYDQTPEPCAACGKPTTHEQTAGLAYPLCETCEALAKSEE